MKQTQEHIQQLRWRAWQMLSEARNGLRRDPQCDPSSGPPTDCTQSTNVASFDRCKPDTTVYVTTPADETERERFELLQELQRELHCLEKRHDSLQVQTFDRQEQLRLEACLELLTHLSATARKCSVPAGQTYLPRIQ